MDENFEEDRFHEIVLAYTSGRASIKDLEEYADSLKNTEERERATASFFDVLDFTNFHYNGPRAVQERSTEAMSIIRQRFAKPVMP
ncbi:hypothetical protein PSH74_03380 [Pseudomonas hefeiensis]|uniref:CdiI immunity protein domain-containing protein n=1 Tax=Pseudomonas hefeiensis TaxID=2738125 RepID=A0ABY9GD74_9PSED|nr:MULTISPECIES: hypothetical protein [unclassified Pseudomonas]WLH13420.1 hypothetical protein PSH57_03380 [Pseudomonas sp. FP205]WLI40755.1 hypothetical protein PSH74_03380 [Pseudomonas sp. FP821]